MFLLSDIHVNFFPQAVCCTLCIAFGLVLGLSLVRNPPVEILSSQSAANTQSDSPYIETPTKSTARPESAGPSAAPAPSAPKVTTTTTPLPPKVERRDFTSAVARRFESYLDNKQINTFVKWVTWKNPHIFQCLLISSYNINNIMSFTRLAPPSVLSVINLLVNQTLF